MEKNYTSGLSKSKEKKGLFLMAKQVLIIEGWEVPHLIKYAVSYNKVWADDTGQDMSGEKKRNFNRIISKIECRSRFISSR